MRRLASAGVSAVSAVCVVTAVNRHTGDYSWPPPPTTATLPEDAFVSSLASLAETGIQRLRALADISRSALCRHSNETRAPIANQPNSAQLEGIPNIPQTYIWVRAVVWECGEGQTDTQTHSRDQYTFRLGYASREM